MNHRARTANVALSMPSQAGIIVAMNPSTSTFLGWIKRRILELEEIPAARRPINLAISGLSTPLSRAWLAETLANRGRVLAARVRDPHELGLPALIDSIRHNYSIAAEREIVAMTGASGGMRLVAEALLGRTHGADVLVECPTYEPLLLMPKRFGAKVRRLPRKPCCVGDLATEIERHIRPETRLVVLSNLHNPTGAYLPVDELAAAVAAARRVAPEVIFVVDETFLDLGPKPLASAASLASPVLSPVVVIGSLSKSYGLGELRCGWVSADRAVWPTLLDDWVMFESLCPAVCEHLATAAFRDLPALRSAGMEQLARNRIVAAEGLARLVARGCIAPQELPYGCVAFLRLLHPNLPVDLLDQLAAEHGVLVAPGRFFGDDYGNYFRIGFGGDTDQLREGLARLEAGLTALCDESTS